MDDEGRTLAAVIGTANELNGRGVPLTYYRIRVEKGVRSWSVLRSMTDFRSLQQTLLRSKQSSVTLPALPGLLSAIFSSDPATTLEALDQYLHQLLASRTLSKIPALLTFLSEPATTMSSERREGVVGGNSTSSLPPLLPVAVKYLAALRAGGGELLCVLDLTSAATSLRAAPHSADPTPDASNNVSGKWTLRSAAANSVGTQIWNATLLPPQLETKQLVIATVPGRGLEIGGGTGGTTPQLMLIQEDGGLVQHTPPSAADIAATEVAADELRRVQSQAAAVQEPVGFDPLGALKKLLGAGQDDLLATRKPGSEATVKEGIERDLAAGPSSTVTTPISTMPKRGQELEAGVLPVLAFTLLKALYGKRVTRLSAGGGHVLALTEGTGPEVLSWGLGDEGQLGHGVRHNTHTTLRFASPQHSHA